MKMWQVQTFTATAGSAFILLLLHCGASLFQWSIKTLEKQNSGETGELTFTSSRLLCMYIPHVPHICSDQTLLSYIHIDVSTDIYIYIYM